MSSKYKGKSSKSSSFRGGDFPTRWSDWEYNEEHKCDVRYRLKSPGNYEYQYESIQQNSVSSSIPRTSDSTLEPIREQSYTSFSNYQTATAATSIDNLTQTLDQTSLGTVAAQQMQITQPLPAPASVSHGYSGYITTRDRNKTEEEFDPHYKVHGGWEFQWGKVFKILWAEPTGKAGSQHLDDSQYSVRKGPHGETFHAKVRRFVIIDARDGHCICLPIMTYTGQGVNKRGVHAADHAIIYTHEPVWFKGEKDKGLRKKPIRVEPTGKRAAQHKLDAASRLNYAKLYTVEYNVKVWFIGKIHADSEYQLTADYNLTHPPMASRGKPPDTASEDSYGYAGGAENVYQNQQPSTGYNAPLGRGYPNYSDYPATGSGYQHTQGIASYATESYPVQTATYSSVQMTSYPATSSQDPTGYEAPTDPFYGRRSSDPSNSAHDSEPYYD